MLGVQKLNWAPLAWRAIAFWVLGWAQCISEAQSVSNCSDSVLGQDLSLVNSEIQRAIDAAHWGKAYNLRAHRNPFIVVTPKAVLLYGRPSSEKRNASDAASAFFDAFSGVQPGKEWARCFAQSSDVRVPTAVVFEEPERLGLEPTGKARLYHFVYENSEDSPGKPKKLVNLAKALGPYLVVNVRDFSRKERLEAGRTLVHEGAHLFGQNAALHGQPPSALLTRSSRGDVEERMLESEYAKLVFREARYAAWALRRILLGSLGIERDVPMTACDNAPLSVDRGPTSARFFSKLELQRHFHFLYSCLARRNGGSLKSGESESRIGRNELFWYFVEGVPQYIEDQYMLGGDTLTLSRDDAIAEVLTQFEPYCTSANGQDIVKKNSGFHPLMLGSAFLHILEKIHGGREALEEKFGFDTQGLANWFDIGSSYQRLVLIGEPKSINELHTCQ